MNLVSCPFPVSRGLMDNLDQRIDQMLPPTPLQCDWKLKKDNISRFIGKSLWFNTLLLLSLMGQGDDYELLNRLFNAQVKLLQINGKRLQD